MNDTVIINLAMLKIGDKLLEMKELLAYYQEQVDELERLMAEWGEVLNG